MAAVDYFLKIDNIRGESRDEGFPEHIEVESFSWGESNHGSFAGAGGGGAGKVSIQDFHFTKRLDKTSPLLFFACASGQHIIKATLTCRKAAGEGQQGYLFYKFKLQDCLVSSLRLSDDASTDEPPMEMLSLNFAKVVFNEYFQAPDGSLTETRRGWDIPANRRYGF